MATPSNPVSPSRLNEISADFQSGIDVLKWPEDLNHNPIPIDVHLSIDSKGYYLICFNKNTTEIECLDLALIHDTRTGLQVSLPPETEKCKQINIGQLGVPISQKWITMYYGNTFVPSSDLRVMHFSCKSVKIAQKWTEQLFLLGHRQSLRNLSSLECLEKFHSKIIISLINPNRKTIPVRSLIQFLCKNAQDNSNERKIRQILKDLELPSQIDSMINTEQFTFNVFFRFYMHLMDRREIDILCNSIAAKHQKYLTVENVKEFIKQQNDVRDGCFAMDRYEQKARDLIQKYMQDNGHITTQEIYEEMSRESFLRYLLSSDNLVIDPTKLDLFMNMKKPLSHYFISSSHNTYLTGSQWAGRASVEIYRQVLLTGCRCIELDVLDSDRGDDEPEITHIHTLIKRVYFRDVILAIRDYAFKVTSYALTLSLENHCRPKAQAKMARYLVDILGDKLIIEPLETHPCQVNCPLPSPHDLQNKILIKNKKVPSNPAATISDESFHREQTPKKLNPGHNTPLDDDFSSDDDGVPLEILENPKQRTRSLPESIVMSDLVHYTVPVQFTNFAQCKERNRHFEMSSFSEDKAQSLIRDHAKDFLAYNQRQLSRIYPRGKRLDSSNYNPYLFWPIGCQMVALNYQTLDIPMQINLGFFSFNNACGYIEKPSVLCEPRNSFDPKVRESIENVAGYDIDIKVLSGQFLCQNREPTFVDVHIYGTYGNVTKRDERQIRAKHWNGFQAIYDNTDVNSDKLTIRFSKVILPEMAALRFAVSSEDGAFIGQSFLPIAYLRSGYRHIVLRNEMNIPVRVSSLFVLIQKKIHVNAKDQIFSDRLVDPLANKRPSLDKLQENFNNEKDDLPLNDVCEHPNSPKRESNNDNDTEISSGLFEEIKGYQKHAIAGSAFKDTKLLREMLSFNDIKPEEIIERNRSMHDKLRRISDHYEKEIKKEEDALNKYLHVQSGELSPHHIRLRRTESPIEKKNIEKTEQNLRKLYSDKYHQQEYLESKYLTEYYEKIEKTMKGKCNKWLDEMANVLRDEKSRVERNIGLLIDQGISAMKKSETNKNRNTMLKEKCTQMSVNVVAAIFHKLEEMCKQTKEILQTNLQTNLNQLEEQKCREIDRCCTKYVEQFHKLETRLQYRLHNDEHDLPHIMSSASSSSSPLRVAGVSLSTPTSSSVELTTSSSHIRRQTMK